MNACVCVSPSVCKSVSMCVSQSPFVCLSFCLHGNGSVCLYLWVCIYLSHVMHSGCLCLRQFVCVCVCVCVCVNNIIDLLCKFQNAYQNLIVAGWNNIYILILIAYRSNMHYLRISMLDRLNFFLLDSFIKHITHWYTNSGFVCLEGPWLFACCCPMTSQRVKEGD